MRVAEDSLTSRSTILVDVDFNSDNKIDIEDENDSCTSVLFLLKETKKLARI